jgi:translation initiation factor 4A
MTAAYGTRIKTSADETTGGNDVIIEAPPATGKTQGLCIAALQIIDDNIKTCQALMLTSSFDVAQQFQKFASDIGQYMTTDRPASVGRSDIGDDLSALQHGQQFVVGTPDRVLELIQRGAITLHSLKLFVLDEVDRLVSCGSTRQILDIHAPSFTQVVFLSVATPRDVMKPATSLKLRDVLHIIVKKNGRPLEGIKQFVIAVEKEEQKFEVLSDLIKTLGHTQIVIFCNLRRTMEVLAKSLTDRGITASAMHGDMPAFERAAIMKEFRTGSARILLATNLLARGINEMLPSVVINYDLPAKHEDYVHRTSSDRRIEGQGIAVNLTTAVDVHQIQDIERYFNTKMEERDSGSACVYGVGDYPMLSCGQSRWYVKLNDRSIIGDGG